MAFLPVSIGTLLLLLIRAIPATMSVVPNNMPGVMVSFKIKIPPRLATIGTIYITIAEVVAPKR